MASVASREEREQDSSLRSIWHASIRNLAHALRCHAGHCSGHAGSTVPRLLHVPRRQSRRCRHCRCHRRCGKTYIAGESLSSNFPAKALTGAPAVTATNNGFVAKIAPDGQKIIWNYFLGGDGNTRPNALALDPDGNIWITGRTGSRNFPLLNAVQTKQTGLNIAFLTSSAPTAKYSTPPTSAANEMTNPTPSPSIATAMSTSAAVPIPASSH